MADMLLEVEGAITGYFGWPSYAVRTIGALSASVGVALVLQYATQPKAPKSAKGEAAAKKVPDGFRKFQVQYLTAFLLIILADWLQGTNMYALYKGYDVDIASLFLTGFLSSAVFGTFLGIYVDTWGRRLGCIIFCILEVIINAMEHVPEFWTLWLGRILGGISTSLLFTAFESWMVTEHRKRGFPEELLESTFAISSAGFGITAILAGLVAQVSADISGDIGPFQLAIALTIVVGVLVWFWPENVGESSNDKSKNVGFMQEIKSSISVASKAIYRSPGMLFLGLSQAFFEGGMYTFVFMWVPSLMTCTGGMIPTGLLFSCLMLAMTFGGTMTSVFLNAKKVIGLDAAGLCILMQVLAVGSMAVPTVMFEFWPVFIAFLVFESTVGMFNCCGGMLRSKYFPDKIQSSVMSVFRVPLNALVVLGTKLAGWANTAEQLQQVFMVVVGMQSIALVMQLVIFFFFPPPAPEKLNDIVKYILEDEEDAGDKSEKKKAMMKKMVEAKNKSPRKKSGGRAKSGSRSPKKVQ